MPVNWHALTAFVDNTVDEMFGELIRFIPWTDKDSYGGGTEDQNRAVVNTVGIYVSKDATVTMPPGGFNHRIANSDLTFSIRAPYIETVREGDRALLLDPVRQGGKYEIAFISPGDTDRSLVHLLRLKET